MLVDSPRLTPHDRQVWARLEHYDDVLSRDPRLARRADDARRGIEGFAAAGPCYCGVSWGKDSVVVAHLLATCDAVDVPLVWMRTEGWENPDCYPVRDAFLQAYPHMADRYHEIITDASQPRWWETTGEGLPTVADALPSGLAEAQARWGVRYVSGIRAAESRIRRMSIGRHGATTRNTCKPIATWDTSDVFAHLAAHDLPTHPAYAMSAGGHYPREQIRVATLGGIRGGRAGRHEWEALYYSDIVGRARGGA